MTRWLGRPRQDRAFTLIELLVVIAIIALLIGILLPALAKARLTSQVTKNSAQQRSIHQSFFQHASTNRGWYTGYDSIDNQWKATWRQDDLIISNQYGFDMGSFPRIRFSELVALEYVPGEVLIHPAERDPREVWTPVLQRQLEQNNEGFDYRHYSYAVTELGWDDDPNYSEARTAWRDDLNAMTPILSDRLFRLVGQQRPYLTSDLVGMFSERPGEGAFQLCVAWNDGHVTVNQSPVIGDTQFGRIFNSADLIFSRGHDEPSQNRQTGVPRGLNRDIGSSAYFVTWQWDQVAPIDGF